MEPVKEVPFDFDFDFVLISGDLFSLKQGAKPLSLASFCSGGF